MSWQASQPNPPGARAANATRPTAHWAAAAALASHKQGAAAALQALQETLQTTLKDIPDDISFPQFQAGLARYLAAPPPPARPEYPLLAQQGRVSLREGGGDPTRPPVVLIPSLINRGYILDLLPGHSLRESLVSQGLRVMLIDWGDPAAGDAPHTLESLITERLEPLLHQAAAHARQPVALVGYCMGGLLALAAGVRLGKDVLGKLALAATPWDFSATQSASHMQQVRVWLEPWLAGQSVLPPAPIAQYFWGLEPWGPIRRLMAYGQEQDAARLAHLTALEDWLADGLALDAPIAKDMLLGWYAENTAFLGEWQVGGTRIRPQSLDLPLHITLTQRDVLVPLASSLPLVGQAPRASVHSANTGHVGLVAGRRAESEFFIPLGKWLTQA